MHPTAPIFTETSLIVTISVLGGVAVAWAIVVGVITVSRIVVKHRERMAQIGMGANLSSTPGTYPHPSAESAHAGDWPRKSAV